jgi:predicted outer membrane protein
MNINKNIISSNRHMTLAAAGFLLAMPLTKGATALAAADQDFILAAAQGGMAEVKLGDLAGQNGTRADVKDFGRMMAKDHSAINEDLKMLAAQKGVTLPDSLDSKHQRMFDKLYPPREPLLKAGIFRREWKDEG